MIPAFVDIGSPWKVLPEGVHEATIGEVELRFATSDHRRKLFSGFSRGADVLHKAGCRHIYLDGSFISEKPRPNDYDVCWEPLGVDDRKLGPIFFDFSDNCKKQKVKYFGEYFPSSFSADGVATFLKYFQTDKYTGKAKGILCVRPS